MTLFRRLLSDRSGAIAMMAIIVQLFVLQAVSAAYACAGMDAAKAMGTFVICKSETPPSNGHAPEGPGSHDCCIDCMCATGCANAPSLLAASLDQTGLANARLHSEARLSWPLAIDALGPRAPPLGLADKRGPPFLSV